MSEAPTMSAAVATGARGAQRDQAGLSTVKKSLAVLSAIASSGSEVGISELSRNLGYSKPAIHRIVYALLEEKYLYQNPATKRYSIGPEAFRIGSEFRPHKHAGSVARTCLQGLADRIGYSSYLGGLSGNTALIIDYREGNSPIRVDSARTGSARPLHATAIGKAILAALPTDDARSILASTTLSATARNTKTTVEEVMADLDRCRADGYSVSDEESLDGVISVGAFLAGTERSMPMAISVSIPALTRNSYSIRELADAVMGASREISELLG